MFKKINLQSKVKQNKVLVLIFALVALFFGVLCIITPFFAGSILVWVIIGLIGLFALLSILKFIFPGKNSKRNGLSLAAGLVLGACVALILIIGLTAKEVVFEGQTISGFNATTLRIIGIASIVLGIISTISNIFLLCSVGNQEKSERGWIIAKAILGIAVGVLMVIFPFVMMTVSIILGGVYCIVVSIGLIYLDVKFWKD